MGSKKLGFGALMCGFLLVLPLHSFSQETALSKLLDRVEELKIMEEDKLARINNLNIQITNLSNSNATLIRRNSKLKKELEAKTQEVFELTGQLSDLTFEYEKLILEITRLGGENEDLREVILDIKQAKEVLSDSLASSMEMVDHLSNSLREKNLQAELLNARNKALERRIEELVNYAQEVVGVEVLGNFPYAGGVTFMYGKISRGGNMLYGVKTGVLLYEERFGINVNTTLGGRLIPVGVVLKVALDKRRKLDFNYVSTENNQTKVFKWFGSVEANYAIPVGNRSIDSNYNRGGFGGFAGAGTIFDFNENVKPYLIGAQL